MSAIESVEHGPHRPTSGRESNGLLAAVPQVEFDRFAARMQRVRVALAESLCPAGETQAHVDFPISGMVSVVVVMSDGQSVEAATIGVEGTTGYNLLIGERTTAYRLIQQVEGESLRMSSEDFETALAECPELQRLTQRYALALLHQCGQNAACNRTHTVDRRMARWLLSTSDRTARDDFYITQEFLAEMLGVRRQSVNLVAGTLQQSGLIAYRRGKLRILDRDGLGQLACECYSATAGVYSRLLGSGDQSIPTSRGSVPVAGTLRNGNGVLHHPDEP